MAYYSGLNKLRDVLASMYYTESQARSMIAEAGLAEQTIDYSGSVVEIWKNILSKAQDNNQVQDLINVARKHAPKNELLAEAEKVFQAASVPPLPTLDEQPDSGGISAAGGSRGGNVSISVGGNNSGIIGGDDIKDVNLVKAGDVEGDANILLAGNQNIIRRGSHVMLDHSSIIKMLDYVLDEIIHAQMSDQIDADTATDVEYQIKKALNQAQKPDADNKTITGYLKAAKDIISAKPSVSKLLTALANAITLVQRSP